MGFFLHLQQEKEGRKDADPRAEGVLIDEMSPDEDGGESAVRNPCMFNVFHNVFEFLTALFPSEGPACGNRAEDDC